MVTKREVVLMLDELVEQPHGEAFVKSKDIAGMIGCSSRAVGRRLGQLHRADDRPFTLEKWSKASSGITWRVEVEDRSEMLDYLDSVAPS